MKHLKLYENFEQGELNIKWIRHLYTDDDGWMEEGMADYGVYDEDKLIATVFLDDDKSHLWIRGLEVKKEFRGKGYGKRVLDAIVKWAKNNKFKCIELNYHKSNKIAYKLYKNYGFYDINKDNDKDSPVNYMRIDIK